MAFDPVVPPRTKAPHTQAVATGALRQLKFNILNNFSVSSWLLLGGCLFLPIAIFLPALYILAPLVLILLGRLAYTLLITFHIIPNPYLKNSILHRTAALVPDENGNFSDEAGAEPVVCFHLGAKYNHPLGIFAPNVKELGDHFEGMLKELDSSLGHQGFLGGSFFYSPDRDGIMELTFISYWRTIDAIHNFAYGPLHRKAWEWWNGLTQKESMHLGINHEIFAAGPHQWEAIYLNHQPTLLGACTYLRKGDKLVGGTVPDTYLNGLMDARKGKLRGSAGRLGWQPTKLYEKHGAEPPPPAYDA
jgi:heme-degrading monooxygenase HmoA